MILLEQNIELHIFHLGKLKKYTVIELLKDDEGVSFKIFLDELYLFTLIPTMKDNYLTFELQETAMMPPAEWDLYLKIKASLYSIFLSQPPS